MKRVLRLFVITVLLSLVSAQTTGKIKGTITSNDGKSLVGANVSVSGTGLGAASDDNGNYTIINVPVGSYSLTYQYIGFKTKIVDGVRISSDLTTVMNVGLPLSTVAGEEVRVVAEKPLVKRDATNTKRVISAEVIESLPLRSADNIVGLQAGVVDNHVRGSRTGDNAYYVDGVLMKDHWNGRNVTGSLSQVSMEEISLEAGGFGAEYGGANGGIVNIISKTGGSKFSGGVEVVSDFGATEADTDPDKLYSYGYQLFNFQIGGPMTDKFRWYLSVEDETHADKNPSYGSHPYGEVTAYQTLSTTDSAFIWSQVPTADENGVLNVANNVFYYEEVVRNNPDTTTTHVVGTNYSRKWGPKRNNDSHRTRISGNVGADFGSFRMKLGYSGYNYLGDIYSSPGVTTSQRSNDDPHNYQLLNWENMRQNRSGMNMAYANGTFTLSSKSYVRATASLKSYTTTSYNDISTDKYEIADKPWVEYGRRTTDWGSANYYHRDDGKQALPAQGLVYFASYGRVPGSYSSRSEDQTGFRLDYVTNISNHEIKTGFENYSTIVRYYGISQGYEIYEQIAKVDANGDGEVTKDEIGDYNSDGSAGTDKDLLDWKFSSYRNAYTTNLGYDIFGEETDEYSLDNHGQAPGNPVSTRLYLQDQIEYSDVVVKLGLAFETWDPNTQGPDSDGDGKADEAGLLNINTVDNRIDRTGWTDVESHSAIHPRVGFAFPISDKTNFRAQYGTFWQEPANFYVYLSDSRLAANVSQGNMVTTPNPSIQPEKTTSYEVGLTQQIGEYAALDVVGFYKEVRDYMLVKNRTMLLNGSDFNMAYYSTGDYGVTKGFSFNLGMRRVQGFLTDFNYTFMEARGTGSDPASNFNIAWIGDTYPTIVNRLDFDQSHTGSVIVDYRAPKESGLVAGFGMSAVYSFGSGQAYTPSKMVSAIFDRGWFAPLSAINAGSLPWFNRLDLRIDKKMNFGGVNANVYLLVLNALKQENVNTVVPTSGNAATDGWLETAAGQIWLESQNTAYPGVDAETLYYDRLRNPTHWDIPRVVRFGIEFGF